MRSVKVSTAINDGEDIIGHSEEYLLPQGNEDYQAALGHVLAFATLRSGTPRPLCALAHAVSVAIPANDDIPEHLNRIGLGLNEVTEAWEAAAEAYLRWWEAHDSRNAHKHEKQPAAACGKDKA